MSYLPPDFPEDRINPYAPPKADFDDRPLQFLPEGGAYVRFEIGEILTRTFEIFTQNVKLCLGTLSFHLALTIVLGGFGLFLYRLLMQSGQENLAVFAVIGIAIFYIIAEIGLVMGMLHVLLKLAKGQTTHIVEVLGGGQYFWRAVGATILLQLCMIGVSFILVLPVGIAGVLLGEQKILMVVVVILTYLALFLASIYMNARLGQAFFCIIDRKVGPLTALKTSAELTRGRTGTIFLIWLLTTLMNTAGTMACYLGLLVTLPFSTLMLAVTYVALTGATDELEFLPDSKPPLDLDFDGVA
ncbi:hypothetical protein ACYOEI_24960 [Singulisphaera rosea]